VGGDTILRLPIGIEVLPKMPADIRRRLKLASRLGVGNADDPAFRHIDIGAALFLAKSPAFRLRRIAP
jgi:hypothetical protein